AESWAEALKKFGEKFPQTAVEFKRALVDGDLVVKLDGKPVEELDDVFAQLLYLDGDNELVIRVDAAASIIVPPAEISGLRELEYLDPKNADFVTKIMKIRVGGKFVFSQADAKLIAHARGKSSYEWLCLLTTLLVQKNKKGEVLFDVEQALKVRWTLDTAKVRGFIDYLQAWESDGHVFTDADVRLCVWRGYHFSRESFGRLWQRFEKFGFTPRNVLEYLLYPDDLRKALTVWNEKPPGQWPQKAARMRWLLASSFRVNADDVKFLFQQVLGSRADSSIAEIDAINTKDQERFTRLKKYGPLNNDEIKWLLASLSADMRLTTAEIIKVYVERHVKIWDKYGFTGHEAANHFIASYRWRRAKASLARLIAGTIIVINNHRAYLDFLELSPRARSAVILFYIGRREGKSDANIAQALVAAYEPEDIAAARQYLSRTYLDAGFEGNGLHKLVASKTLTPLEQFENNEKGDVESEEVPVAISINGMSGVMRAETLGFAIARFLLEPGNGRFEKMMKSGRYTAVLNGREIILSNNLRLRLNSKETYKLEIEPVADKAATGGIDLASGMHAVESRNHGTGAAFQFDPAALHQMDGAEGLNPVIISMESMKNIPEFLGLPAATTP
ncbi:MAG: hypothetical protein WCI27_03645, partial [Candidatus Omnitrophota bacterium]